MRRRFPAGFEWGAATAAYQVEGAVDEDGRGESIWDRFSHMPGRVRNGDTGDAACDHYHRWREDLELMRDLGLTGYRFSIAWPRVFPTGRPPVNDAGLDFYRRLVDGLRERGIAPFATLYHWDLPQPLEDAGGWRARETAELFAEYAATVFDALGAGVARWATHNEPWVVAYLGHGYGLHAPGLRDWAAAVRVSHHLLLSHGLAVRAFREAGAEGEIGIVLDRQAIVAATDEPADVAAARRLDGFRARWFLDPLFRAEYPADMLDEYARRWGPVDAIRAGDLAAIAEPIDFLGVNYYTRLRVKDAPGVEPLDLAEVPPELPTTEMGWEVAADGLLDVLTRLGRDHGELPLYVAENGAAFDDPPPVDGVVEDPDRVDYLRQHVGAVAAAIERGLDVRGYYVWSLLDNFEWAEGYSKRFGIVHVDYATQRRTPKRSALWYRHLIATEGATSPRRA